MSCACCKASVAYRALRCPICEGYVPIPVRWRGIPGSRLHVARALEHHVDAAITAHAEKSPRCAGLVRATVGGGS